MNGIRIHLIFSIILAIVLFGCKKEEESFKITGLEGEWIWMESIGGIGGWTLTPESENMTKKLIIEDFVYKQFVNDSLVLEAVYEVGISEEPLLGSEEKTFIRIDSGIKQAVVISGSELELIEQCYDCFYHRYSRN